MLPGVRETELLGLSGNMGLMNLNFDVQQNGDGLIVWLYFCKSG